MKRQFSALLLGSLMLVSCGEKKNPFDNSAPQEYAAVHVKKTEVCLNTIYPATLEGVQFVEIRPRVGGNITAIYVDEGQRVVKGQRLFSIDSKQYADAVKSAQANIDVVRSSIETAQLTLDNKRKLHERKIISDFDLKTSENALASLKAQLQSAKAQLASARENLSWCTITASSEGVIGRIAYHVGALVGPSMQVPFTEVSDISKVRAYFSITEKQQLDMLRKAKGDKQAVLQSFPKVHLILSDGSEYAHAGVVDAVSGVVDESTGSVMVRATFVNPEGLLRSGSSANIQIPTDLKEVIVVPQKSTVEIQNKIFVYTVDDKNKVEAREIKVAAQNNGVNYVVLQGLSENDRVVLEGVQSLKSGMTIVPITLEQSAEKRKQAAQAIKEGKLPF